MALPMATSQRYGRVLADVADEVGLRAMRGYQPKLRWRRLTTRTVTRMASSRDVHLDPADARELTELLTFLLGDDGEQLFGPPQNRHPRPDD